MTDTYTPEQTYTDEELVEQLVEICWSFSMVFTDIELQPFQEEFGRAVLRSVIGNRGEELTALISRQAGKTEVMACMIVSIMILLPLLAKAALYHHLLKKFERGVLVGLFAPTGEQIQTMFDRVWERIGSDRAKQIFAEDESFEGEKALKTQNVITLRKCRSLVRMSTANARAKIESKTYHVIIIDEAQGADETMITKSISPMGARTNATKVMIGTPSIVIGYFYKAIKRNKRAQSEGGIRRHFEYNWKVVAKYNPDYAKYVENERQALGEDSDEFRMAYMVEWILERGMFVTTSRLDDLGDRSMARLKSFQGPCYVGIDPARKVDSTVVTVVWPDRETGPNENGLYHHRVLNWLEMPGEGWEEQYFRILEFISNFNVQAVGVDEGGMGDVVIDRMRHLLPSYIDVVACKSSNEQQSVRWKYLAKLLTGTHPDYGNLLAYPAHASARKTKTWKRFYQQMSELEKTYKGAYMLAEAPDENNAHDDFCDSLAIACSLTMNMEMDEIEQVDNFLYR